MYFDTCTAQELLVGKSFGGVRGRQRRGQHDESSKDEGSQYNYEFKTFCTFTVFVVLKSTFVRLVTTCRVRSKLQPNLAHSAHSMNSELVIFVLEDSQGTSWFESAIERKPCQYVRARICVA